MTRRIALVQKGRCAVFGALARLQDSVPFEWKLADDVAGCDAAFTLFDSESDFTRAMQTPPDALPRLVVDFSPVSAWLFTRTQRELAQSGVELVGAQSGAGPTPRLYADTSLQSHALIAAVIERAASRVHFTGACGTSKTMATVEKLLFAVSCAASAEALSLATRAGLDAAVMRGLLAKGSGANEALALGTVCAAADAVQAIVHGQGLGRTHEHALPLCAAAKSLHQWQGARA